MITKIKEVFEEEFRPLLDKFEIIDLMMYEVFKTKDPIVSLPGVYIFWYKNKIIKVGRHLENSRKRALEHIRDNTRNSEFEMKDFKSDSKDYGLVLINCKVYEDYHWVAAVEIFMERILNPVIKSKRTG